MIPISYETNKKTVTMPMEEYEAMKGEINRYRIKDWEAEEGRLRYIIEDLEIKLALEKGRPWWKKLFGIK